jgi:hypothetical protein
VVPEVAGSSPVVHPRSPASARSGRASCTQREGAKVEALGSLGHGIDFCKNKFIISALLERGLANKRGGAGEGVEGWAAGG